MRSGFVALIGRPNVGKSTLLNALAGEDLSITTPKPETTRQRILAVVTREDGQLVFVDTPGLHRPMAVLGEVMNEEARAGARDADVLVCVIDATAGQSAVDDAKLLLEGLGKPKLPLVMVLNKVDRVRAKSTLLPLLEAAANIRAGAAVVPTSADRGDGVAQVLEECIARLPDGEPLYPPDTLTDRSLRYLSAERVRQAVIHETGEEIPYVTAVEIETFDERAPTLRIEATIHVERDGQKKIVVGERGERIKAIGTRARAAIEELLGRKVYLQLWVKVTPGWTKSRVALERLGYAVPRDMPATGRPKTVRSTRRRKAPVRGRSGAGAKARSTKR